MCCLMLVGTIRKNGFSGRKKKAASEEYRDKDQKGENNA